MRSKKALDNLDIDIGSIVRPFIDHLYDTPICTSLV